MYLLDAFFLKQRIQKGIRAAARKRWKENRQKEKKMRRRKAVTTIRDMRVKFFQIYISVESLHIVGNP